MSQRDEIAQRHGIPHLADELTGETDAALEADAAAKAALIGMFSPKRADEQPPEPPVEGLPAGDKQVADYTPEEWEAVHENTRRTLRQREREAGEERKRDEAEANRTDEQRLGDRIRDYASPQAKRERDKALVESLLPDLGGEEGEE